MERRDGREGVGWLPFEFLGGGNPTLFLCRKQKQPSSLSGPKMVCMGNIQISNRSLDLIFLVARNFSCTRKVRFESDRSPAQNVGTSFSLYPSAFAPSPFPKVGWKQLTMGRWTRIQPEERRVTSTTDLYTEIEPILLRIATRNHRVNQYRLAAALDVPRFQQATTNFVVQGLDGLVRDCKEALRRSDIFITVEISPNDDTTIYGLVWNPDPDPNSQEPLAQDWWHALRADLRGSSSKWQKNVPPWDAILPVKLLFGQDRKKLDNDLTRQQEEDVLEFLKAIRRLQFSYDQMFALACWHLGIDRDLWAHLATPGGKRLRALANLALTLREKTWSKLLLHTKFLAYWVPKYHDTPRKSIGWDELQIGTFVAASTGAQRQDGYILLPLHTYGANVSQYAQTVFLVLYLSDARKEFFDDLGQGNIEDPDSDVEADDAAAAHGAERPQVNFASFSWGDYGAVQMEEDSPMSEWMTMDEFKDMLPNFDRRRAQLINGNGQAHPSVFAGVEVCLLEQLKPRRITNPRADDQWEVTPRRRRRPQNAVTPGEEVGSSLPWTTMSLSSNNELVFFNNELVFP